MSSMKVTVRSTGRLIRHLILAADEPVQTPFFPFQLQVVAPWSLIFVHLQDVPPVNVLREAADDFIRTFDNVTTIS